MLDETAEKKISNEGYFFGFLAFIGAGITIYILVDALPKSKLGDTLSILLYAVSTFAFCIIFLVHNRYIIWRRKSLCEKRGHEFGAIDIENKEKRYLMCDRCGYYKFLESSE